MAQPRRTAWRFLAPKSGTVDGIEFRVNAVTQAPTNGLKVSFQDLSNGYPDGVADQYRVVTISTAGWYQSGIMSDDGTDGGVKRTLTQGQMLAAVFEFNNFVSGDSLAIAGSSQDWKYLDYSAQFIENLTGSWTQPGNIVCVFALKYSDGSYGRIVPGVVPFNTTVAYNYSSTSSPDEVGVRFRLPISVKIKGVAFGFSSLNNDEDDWDYVIYEMDDSVVASVSAPGEERVGITHQVYNPRFFGSDVTLQANTWYRLTAKATGTNAINFSAFVLDALALADASPVGSDFYITKRTDLGSWTDVTTECPRFRLYVTEADIGAGGGLMMHPGMSGGFSG